MPEDQPSARKLPPNMADMPVASTRRRVGGPKTTSFSLSIRVVTPIFGGSPRARDIDRIDVIRAPSIRGQLRFWWRALYGHTCTDAADLFAKESAIWGKASPKEGGGRSEVEITVQAAMPPSSQITRDTDVIGQRDPSAYALWVANNKKERDRPQTSAHRYNPEIDFTLVVTCPLESLCFVERTIRTWLIFGGYGGRTRRGVGSLTVTSEMDRWLPKEATRAAINKLLGIDGGDIFAPGNPNRTVGVTPWLSGSNLFVGPGDSDARTAWTTSLGWLRDFRQGSIPHPSQGQARRSAPASDQNRPSVSNWPEPDKIRQLPALRTAMTWAHSPMRHGNAHNSAMAWPRASFGLPIGIRFQLDSRKRTIATATESSRPIKWQDLHRADPNYGTEPGGRDGFWLRWQIAEKQYDRLASPLIIKAMPLTYQNGGAPRFASCALWLNRAMPQAAQVGLYEPLASGQFRLVAGSKTGFEVLEAPATSTENKDVSEFVALRGQASVRSAFANWLVSTNRAQQVVR